jgi:four helix bundle protein
VSFEDLKDRTFQFGIESLRLAEVLAKSSWARSLSGQLIRSATSVGANYRAACRAKSRADFISKMKTVEEECDEALYWLEVLIAYGLVKPDMVSPLLKEGTELLKIVVASIKTAKNNVE